MTAPALIEAHRERDRAFRHGGMRLRQTPDGSFARASIAREKWRQFDVIVSEIKGELAIEQHDYAKVTRLIAEAKLLTGGRDIWEVN
jgi:hypothetical protein